MKKSPHKDTENLIDGKYRITDLVDMERLQGIFNKFTLATGFTIGFLDHPGLNVLAQSGWRDICTKFHRGCEASACICNQSNQKLLNALNSQGQTKIEECGHGMIDCAIPVIINGKHIASLATGQLLLKPPDLERFRKQAVTFGYDEKAYLDALKEIPVVSEKRLNDVTVFMGEIASLISEMGYSNLMIKIESEKLENEFAKHKKLEAILRESEERYASLFKGAVEGILAADIETKEFIFANPSFCNMLGYSEEELKTMHLKDIHPPDALEAVINIFNSLSNGELIKTAEIPCLKKDGSIIYTDVNANYLMIDNRNVIVGFFSDVTVRKQMYDELQNSLAKLKLTIDEAPVSVITTGLDRRFLTCNKAFCDFLGYTEEELKGKTFTEVTFPDDIDIGIDDIEPILAGKKKNSVIKKRYVRKDGGLVWAEIFINLIRNSLGQPWYFLLLDLKHRK